jgi:hypothetical protein
MLKIDVEGHELEVLEGSAGLFSAGRIAVVYCDGYDQGKVPAFLSQYGFSLLDVETLQVASNKVFGLLAIKPAIRKQADASSTTTQR